MWFWVGLDYVHVCGFGIKFIPDKLEKEGIEMDFTALKIKILKIAKVVVICVLVFFSIMFLASLRWGK